MNDKSFGQFAFEAYCKSVDNKSYDNKPIPKWEDLPEHIKQAWEDAAKAVEMEVIFEIEVTLWNT